MRSQLTYSTNDLRLFTFTQRNMLFTLTSTIVLEVSAEDFHVLNAREAAYSESVENLAESRLSGSKAGALVVAVAKERLLI